MEIKQEWKDELEAIATLRGWIINSYAQIEFLLGHLIVAAATLPEYAHLPRRLPRNLERRAEAIFEISSSGPYAPFKPRLNAVLQKLGMEDIDTVRHLLVHGLCIFYATPTGDMAVKFQRFVPSAGGKPAGLKSQLFTRNDLQNYRTRWVAIAQEAVVLFEEITLTLKIADSIDPAPLGFKNAQ